MTARLHDFRSYPNSGHYLARRTQGKRELGPSAKADDSLRRQWATSAFDPSDLGAIFRLGRLQSSGVVSMRQAPDCNPGNEIGQFIDKRLVDRYPEWI
jgi:hypothetical protein